MLWQPHKFQLYIFLYVLALESIYNRIFAYLAIILPLNRLTWCGEKKLKKRADFQRFRGRVESWRQKILRAGRTVKKGVLKFD